MTAQEAQKQIIDEFEGLDDWEDKYRHIIALGKELPPLLEEYRTDDNLVRGCQSQVWLFAEFHNGRVTFFGDSDAAIVKGLVALAFRLYSGKTPEEIIQTSPEFIRLIGLDSHLSPNRTNGFASMIKKIKTFGLAFYLQQQKA